jgi:Flp pilus assembly pilin Flp
MEMQFKTPWMGEEMKLYIWMQQALDQLKNDRRGQDLIEYALMAGFVAVAAGAIMPGISNSISTIFSKVSSVMEVASSQS